MKNIMKNIKKFYKEHRIFSILMAVVIVCVILLCTLLIQCFYTGNKDKYGDRLEDISKYEIKEEKLTEIETKIASQKDVEKVNIYRTGRIIYSELKFKGEVDKLAAQNVAINLLDEFSTDEKSYYDFHFELEKEETTTSEGFLLQGCRNSNGNGLSWNNDREVSE